MQRPPATPALHRFPPLAVTVLVLLIGLGLAGLPIPTAAVAGAEGDADPGPAGPATACQPMDVAGVVAQVLGAPLLGPIADEQARTLAAEHAGTIVLLGASIQSAGQVAELVAGLDAAAPPGLPPLVAVDEEGGRVARFGRAGVTIHLPSAREQAATWTPDELTEQARSLGDQMAALGVDWDLAPVLDLTDADGGVIGDRSYSSDPATAGTHAAAFAAGLQAAGIATAGKHFPDHGLTTLDTHTTVAHVEVDLAALRTRHLEPYRIALPHLDSIMLSHLRISSLEPDLPATLSPQAVAFLRTELGFTGPLVTDDLSMQAVAALVDQPTAALLALQAGMDVMLLGSPQAAAAAHARITQAVQSGEVPLARLHEAARRALTLKDVEGAAASCLLGLPPVAQADAVVDARGTVWAVRDGVRHAVPDPETRSAHRLVPVAYSDAEIGTLPEGPPLRTVRRFTTAAISAPGAEAFDVAVARAAVDAGSAGLERLVVLGAGPGQDAPWARALAAVSATGGAPVLPPTADTGRLQAAVDRLVASGGEVVVIGDADLQAPGASVRHVPSADPVAASVAVLEHRRDQHGPPGTVLVAAPGTPLLDGLLPWLADDAAVLFTDPADADDRVVAQLAGHDGRVLSVGLAATTAEQLGAEPLPEDPAALAGWLHASGWGRGDLLLHAGPADLLAGLPLARAARAVPVAHPGSPAPLIDGLADVVGSWGLPDGAAHTIYLAGSDPTGLFTLGLPRIYRRR